MSVLRSGGRAQIDVRGSFAATGIGNGFDVRQVRRIHQQHLGAVSGEGATADRPREDAREIENADTG